MPHVALARFKKAESLLIISAFAVGSCRQTICSCMWKLRLLVRLHSPFEPIKVAAVCV